MNPIICNLIKENGLFMFYIYNKKGPIREFVDDYLRNKLQVMSPEEGWNALKPLTELGKLLGELNITINIPENIDLLEIPAGEIDLQRLFYWHIFKAYYAKELSFEEMNHINYLTNAILNFSKLTYYRGLTTVSIHTRPFNRPRGQATGIREVENGVNYDWYAPANAHRHSVLEVQDWCSQVGMEMIHQVVELAGITIVARKRKCR